MSYTKVSSDLLYYTANIRKASHEAIDDNRPLQFVDIRNEAILDKAENYELSIVKFSVDTPSLPLYIAEIQPNQPDPFKTIYAVNLSYTTGLVETFLAAPISVEFTQRDFTDAAPNPPNQNQNGLQSVTRAYNSYSYNDLVDDINDALEKAMADLVLLFPGLASIDPPVITFDCDTNKATICARQDSYAEGLGNKISVYISKSLYPLFSSWPVDKYPVSNKRSEYRIRFKENKKNVEENCFGIHSAICICQEYETTQAWAPYTSLVFSTNLIPCQTEYLSPPIIYENGSLRPANANLNNYFGIITDISTQETSMRSNLLYLPTAEYRFVSLFGNQPVFKLDFQVYLQTKLGFLVPFVLHANSSVSIKVLFRKKKK